MSNIVLITGASGGIGLEFARIFASKGFSLILVARSVDKLTKLADELRESHSCDVLILPKDLSYPASATDLYKEVTDKGYIVDCLVNNAGFGDSGPFYTTDIKRDMDMINLNMSSLYILTKLFVKDMISRKSGKILNVASVASFMPGPYMSLYYATKSFVLNFSLGIAKELKNTGVFITVYCPGPTKSNFFKNANASSKKISGMFVMPEAYDVALRAYKAMQTKKVLQVDGISNKFLVFIIRFLPRRFVSAITAMLQK